MGGGGAGGNSTAGGGAPYDYADCPADPVSALYFLLFSLTVGALVLWSQRSVLSFVPYSCKMFVLGSLLGLVNTATHGEGLGMLGDSIAMWSAIDPRLLMAVFLPALTFADALGIDTHMLRRCFWQCFVLGVPGVVITGGALGVAAYAIMGPLYHWSLFTSLMFGAALSANDPPAVNAVMDTVHVPSKLRMVFNGEAHLGSPMAIMLFTILLTVSREPDAGAAQIARDAFHIALTGAVLGFAMGAATYLCVRVASDRTSQRSILIQIALLTSVAYTSYLVADYNVGTSGVTATFTAAIALAASSWPVFASRSTMNNFWNALGFFGNTIIFMLAGLIIGPSLYGVSDALQYSAVDYGNVFALYFVMLATRLVLVVLLFPLLSRIGYGMRRNQGFALSYGMVRGAVSLSLAIVVSRSSTRTRASRLSRTSSSSRRAASCSCRCCSTGARSPL